MLPGSHWRDRYCSKVQTLRLVPYHPCDPGQLAFNFFMPQFPLLQNRYSNSTYLRNSIFPSSSVGKDSACNAGDPGSIPGSGRSTPWRRKWQPTPVLLPEEFHGQRTWWATVHGIPELDTAVWLTCFSRNCTQYSADIVSKCSAKAHYCYCLTEGTLWVSDKFPFLEDDLVFFFWLEAPHG